MMDGKRVGVKGGPIEVGSGICPLGPSPRVKAALRKAIKEIGALPDDALRRLERFFFSKYGIPAGNLLFANSLRELSGAFLASRRPKRILIAGAPRELYGEEMPGVSAELHYLVSGSPPSFMMEADELVRSARAADLVIVSNPDRVTGRLIGEGLLGELCDMAAKGKLGLVIDETLMEFTGREGIDAKGKNILTLRTTANYYGLPGLELAYAVSDAEDIAEIRKRSYGRPNRLAVEAARTALGDAAYKRGVRHFLGEEKGLLLRAFGRDGRVTLFESDANVYLLGFKGWRADFASRLLRGGFAVHECRPGRGSEVALLRMSVLAHDKNVKLARMVCELPSTAEGAPSDEKALSD